MAAFNFPSSPNNGQSYTANGVTWTYSSSSGAWIRSSAVGAQGATGAQGAQGHQGATGTGAQGATGSATITSNANNRVITGGSGTNLVGESTLTYDGSELKCTGGTIVAEKAAIPTIESKNSQAASYARIYLSQTSGSGGYFAINKIGTGGGAYAGGANATQLWASGDAPMLFATNNNERLRIASDGKLVVSTNTSTTVSFDYATIHFDSDNSTVAEGLFINNIAANTGDNASISFSTDSGNRHKSAISHVDTGNYGRGDLVFSIDPDADSGELDIVAHEKLRIKSGGQVLIGTTTEGLATYGEELTLGSSDHAGMTIRSGTSHKGTIYFSDVTSGTDEYIGSLQYLLIIVII